MFSFFQRPTRISCVQHNLLLFLYKPSWLRLAIERLQLITSRESWFLFREIFLTLHRYAIMYVQVPYTSSSYSPNCNINGKLKASSNSVHLSPSPIRSKIVRNAMQNLKLHTAGSWLYVVQLFQAKLQPPI